jgi:hypothetical protein
VCNLVSRKWFSITHMVVVSSSIVISRYFVESEVSGDWKSVCCGFDI